MNRNITYADYSATTPVRREVIERMLPLMSEGFGNASGYHSYARDARRAVENAREAVARALGAYQKNEVYFTSGGTESNHLAVRGLLKGNAPYGGRILISAVEHPALEQSVLSLESTQYEIVKIPVDRNGMISLDALRRELSDTTVLVSVMTVNNEVGTVQPIGEISSFLSGHPALFHTDAVQAIRSMKIDVNELGVDALSLSAHKFYGPKGIGALWVRSGLDIAPGMIGGGQERGLRGGTENVPGIVGLAKALEMANLEREEENIRLAALTGRVLEELPKRIGGCQVTGHPTERHPAIASFVIEDVEGESLLVQLDRLGVAASTGSACSTRTGKASRILKAMGIDERLARGSLRISLGRQTTEEDVEAIIERTVRAVELSRALC